MDNQQGDILLFQTDDDGEINVNDGIVEMSGGLETTAYLSLFGGNEDGSEWWGNLSENEPSKKYNSETQNLLLSIPATSGNLKRIEDSVNRDLAWFLEKKLATSITASVSIIALNTIKIIIDIDQTTFEFIENWRAK